MEVNHLINRFEPFLSDSIVNNFLYLIVPMYRFYDTIDSIFKTLHKDRINEHVQMEYYN